MPSLRTRIAYEAHRMAQALREVEVEIDNKANASTVGGISTALDAKADATAVADLLERIIELEGIVGP